MNHELDTYEIDSVVAEGLVLEAVYEAVRAFLFDEVCNTSYVGFASSGVFR